MRGEKVIKTFIVKWINFQRDWRFCTVHRNDYTSHPPLSLSMWKSSNCSTGMFVKSVIFIKSINIRKCNCRSVVDSSFKLICSLFFTSGIPIYLNNPLTAFFDNWHTKMINSVLYKNLDHRESKFVHDKNFDSQYNPNVCKGQ